MKVIGPVVGNPESTIHIPGLVPVDYESVVDIATKI